MRFRSPLATLACLTLLGTVAVAQEASPPPIFQMTTWELAPSTTGQFMAGLAKQASAARTVGLPAAEVGWWTYSEGNRIIVVAPRQRDAVLANPQTMARIREANAALAEEVTAAFGGVQTRMLSQELLIHAPNLSYDPAAQITPGGAQLIDVIIAPGQGRAFNEAIQALNQVRADVGSPYSMQVFRVRLGQTRTVLVTFYDTQEAFHGANSMPRLMAGKPAAQAAWQAGIEKIMASTTSYTFTMMNYAAAQSYPPVP